MTHVTKVMKGENPAVEHFGVFEPDVDLFGNVVPIGLRDDQLGPDPMVEERARHDGTDYGTAQMSLEFDKAMDDYTHSGPRIIHFDEMNRATPPRLTLPQLSEMEGN